MTDDIDRRMREIALALVQEAPDPPSFEPMTMRAAARRRAPSRREARRPPRRLAVIAGLAALACAVSTITVVVTHLHSADRHVRTIAGLPAPALPPMTPPDEPLAAGFQPVSATFVSPEHGWSLGVCETLGCAALARTTDGGRSWHGIPAPRTAIWGRKGGVATLRFANDFDGWAFGTELWSTHDGGRTWTRAPVSSPGGGSIDSLGWGAGVTYALMTSGGPGGAAPALWRSDSHRDSWTDVPLPGVPSDITAGQVVVRGSAAWVLLSALHQGTRQITMYGTSDGTTWRTIGTPCPSPSPIQPSVAAANPNDLSLVCSEDAPNGSVRNTMFVSHDGGATFAPVADPPTHGIVRWAAQPDAPTILIAASSPSVVDASFDGGNTWSTVVSLGGAQSPWSDLNFGTPLDGVAVSGAVTNQLGSEPPAVLYRTADGGRTWAVVQIGP